MASDPVQAAIAKIHLLETKIEDLKKNVQTKEKLATELEEDVEKLKVKNIATGDENNQLQEELANLAAVYKQKKLLSNVWKNLLAEKQDSLTSELQLLKNKQTEAWEARIQFCDAVDAIVNSKPDAETQ